MLRAFPQVPLGKALFLGAGLSHRKGRGPEGESCAAPCQPRVAASNARAFDLCCGLGGLSVAARDLNMHVVDGVDVNQSVLLTFARNFPQAEAIAGSRVLPAHFDEPLSITVREAAMNTANVNYRGLVLSSRPRAAAPVVGTQAALPVNGGGGAK